MPRHTARALLLTAFATVLALSPVAALAQVTPLLSPDKPLTVEDAVAFAVKKNFDLQLQSYSTDTAKEQLIVAQATFDPSITASVTRNVSQAASNTSRLDGAQTAGTRSDNTTTSVGVSERLITNGTVTLSTNLTRSATNSSNALLNPTFGNGVSARLSQPLLQNAGKKVATANIDRAKIGLTIANISYRRAILTVIANTENAYYTLVAARETLHIRELSLAANQRVLDENKARRDSGVMTDLDVLTAEVNVANSRRGVVQADQAVRDAEDALLNLINVPDFNSRPGPVKFEDYKEGAPDFAAAYKLARDNYPDNLSNEETLKQLLITLEVNRHNQLPQLNLDGSLGYTARSVSTGYADVVNNLPDDHGNNWSLGLSYSMPWGRKVDKSNYRSALINVNSQKLRIDQAEQLLMINVRTAVRSVESNLVAVEIASQATVLAERQYEQQKARLDAGLVTSRVVLQFQDDLETARNNELSAKLTLRRAATELNRLQGTSIERFRVQLPQ